jgi:hypothetical protein
MAALMSVSVEDVSWFSLPNGRIAAFNGGRASGIKVRALLSAQGRASTFWSPRYGLLEKCFESR